MITGHTRTLRPKITPGTHPGTARVSAQHRTATPRQMDLTSYVAPTLRWA